MKIIENGEQDRFGKYPIIFKSASVKQIDEWLFDHYWGYKFAIIFDTTKDEYEVMDKSYVYFLDEVLDEAAEYAGKKVVKDER